MYSVKFAYRENDRLVLGVTSDSEIKQDIELQIRAVDQDRFIMKSYLGQITLQSESVFNDTAVFHVEYEEILNNINANNRSQTLDFVIKRNNNYSNLMTTSSINGMLSEEIQINELSKIIYVKKERGTFNVKLWTKSIAVQAEEVRVNDGKILIRLKEDKTKEVKLFIKRRSYKYITKYSTEIELDRTSENYYSIEIGKIKALITDEQTNFDFTVRTYNGTFEIDDLLKIDFDFAKEIVRNGSNLFELYMTVNKSLAVSLKEKPLSMQAVVSKNEDNGLIFVTSNQLARIGIFRELSLQNSSSDLVEVSNELVDSLSFTIDICDIIKENSSNIDHKYLIVGIDSDNNKYLLSSEEETKFTFDKSPNLHFCINDKGCELINKQNAEKTISLGILGSCYSRSAFNSVNAFFNKDYKSYFNIDFTCFWFSVLSSTSDKIKYNKDDFSNAPEKIAANDINIRREYEKTLFDELQKTNVEYLIIDFFVDAVHGVRKFGEGQYLTPNLDLNATPYFKNNILLETEHFNYKSQGYFDTWKNSVDVFLERIQNIVPLSKLILNMGGLTKTYVEEDHSLKNFVKDKNFDERIINNHNVIWNRMNNYFIAKCPEANVVDMSRFDLYGTAGYPGATPGPHHYEPNYYKAYVGEVAKVIMKERL